MSNLVEAHSIGNSIYDLSDYGLIRASGKDARGFLHAQLSNNIETLTSDHSRLAAWCNAKGRVLALFRVFQHGEDFYLRLPRNLLATTLQRLKMFVLRSQVQLDDQSDAWNAFGLSGPDIDSALLKTLGNAPDGPGSTIHAKGLAVIRVPGKTARFEIHGETAAVAKLQHQFAAIAEASDDWQCREILAGLPEVYPETREAFIPQMLNLQVLDGIDFKKGCYPGQEIVARTQYLGQLKRRMYLARIKSTEIPAPGASVLLSDADESGKNAAGVVVSAARHNEKSVVLLAVLQIESSTMALHVGTDSRAALQIIDLPYSIGSQTA